MEERDWQRAQNLVSNIIAGLVLGVSAVYLISRELGKRRVSDPSAAGLDDVPHRAAIAAHDGNNKSLRAA